tara:strand:+ start:110 stop:307 length:198 start_codon:yes stop_codon:yes gene_type:complete
MMKFPESEKEENSEVFTICSVCGTETDFDNGGIAGYWGIMPVAFCEWCLSSMLDMASQLLGVEEE